MPLIYANRGDELKVIGISSGQSLSKRLAEMGIYTGSVIKIISNQGRGPIIIALGDTKIALGRGMAMKIMGDPIKRVS